MKGEKTDYGIYLVLWFKSLGRFSLPNKYDSIESLKYEILEMKPKEKQIEIIIIDCSIPTSPSKIVIPSKA